MQQIRITRTSDLDSILVFLKERYPLLSEAEIIKMALSNQYYQESSRNQKAREHRQDPINRFTKEEWQKKFAVFEDIRKGITPENEEALEQAIDTAVREVRAKPNNAYGKTPA